MSPECHPAAREETCKAWGIVDTYGYTVWGEYLWDRRLWDDTPSLTCNGLLDRFADFEH